MPRDLADWKRLNNAGLAAARANSANHATTIELFERLDALNKAEGVEIPLVADNTFSFEPVLVAGLYAKYPDLEAAVMCYRREASLWPESIQDDRRTIIHQTLLRLGVGPTQALETIQSLSRQAIIGGYGAGGMMGK